MPVIRVSDDVYKYLQQRARAFEDSPDDVLRRELGLVNQSIRPHAAAEGDNMHPAIRQLVERANVPLEAVTLIRDKLYRLRCRSGKVVANIARQDRKGRVIIGAPKGPAARQGLTDWDLDWLGRWYGADNQVNWYISDGDEPALARVATTLKKLYDI